MTKKGLIVILMALFVVAGLGSAFAVQTGGMTSNNGLPNSNAPRLPQAAFNGAGNEFANGFTAGLDVHVNPDGLGDTLIYNYFNARENMGTYFSVVNTASNYIRARVRFHEGANIDESYCKSGSWEILDFDLCLTPDDAWTGWVVQGTDGKGILCSADVHTLIWDGVTSQTFVAAGGGTTVGCVSFKTEAEGAEPGIKAVDTLEGYWTIIGESTLQFDRNVNDNNPRVIPMTSSNYTCDPKFAIPQSDVPNALFGSAFVADINDPTNSPFYEFNATAIADFHSQTIGGSFAAGTESPTLANGGDHLLGINYILTKANLYGTYLLDGGFESEFILTFPTKRYSRENTCLHDVGVLSTNTGNWISLPTLTNPFASASFVFADNQLEPTVFITVWDLDENKAKGSKCAFSPCPEAGTDVIPFELNVLTVSKTGAAANHIMPSELNPNGLIVVPSAANFDRGWVDINLTGPFHSTVADERDIITVGVAGLRLETFGLPVLGLQLLNNKNYSGMLPMQATTLVGATPSTVIPVVIN
ncbi:MAG: hypothetical protein WA610_05360 [Thermodesulfovibrionales bacterium]